MGETQFSIEDLHYIAGFDAGCVFVHHEIRHWLEWHCRDKDHARAIEALLQHLAPTHTQQ